MSPATVRDYGELRRVLAARREQLGLTPTEVDRIGGLPWRFTRRFELGHSHLSEATLGRMLAALAVRLFVQSRAAQ